VPACTLRTYLMYKKVVLSGSLSLFGRTVRLNEAKACRTLAHNPMVRTFRHEGEWRQTHASIIRNPFRVLGSNYCGGQSIEARLWTR